MDTCDRCGAVAYVKAIKDRDRLPGLNFTLMFCQHHGREQSAALTAQGWFVLDGTNELASPVLEPT